jgi:hypothetical protein
MPNPFQYDVFLSHRAKDNAVVRALAERLRKDGLKVWFDEWEIAKARDPQRMTGAGLQPSEFSLQPLIEDGLEHSRVLVLCMSANAFGSDPDASGLEAGTFRLRDPLNQEPHSMGLDRKNQTVTL